MNRHGPIIIIEDDLDDQFLFKEAFKRLDCKNNLIFFSDPLQALAHLNEKNIKPFLIMSDINMPKLNGFALRKQIQTNEELEKRCIPYLFFTSASDQQSVMDAYSMSVQGFFIKQDSIDQLEKTIKVIVDYWKCCLAPNDV